MLTEGVPNSGSRRRDPGNSLTDDSELQRRRRERERQESSGFAPVGTKRGNYDASRYEGYTRSKLENDYLDVESKWKEEREKRQELEWSVKDEQRAREDAFLELKSIKRDLEKVTFVYGYSFVSSSVKFQSYLIDFSLFSIPMYELDCRGM